MTNAEPNFLLVFALGTSIMLFMAGGIIFFVIFYQKRMLKNQMKMQQLENDYQKELLASTIESQENERKRIASELHDGVGAMLSAAKLNLGMLRSGAIPQDEFPESIDDTKSMIDETIETVRRISKDLLPSSLEKFGLSETVRSFCKKLSNDTIKVSFIESGNAASFSSRKALMIFRIIQETVNNALKHAEASHIEVKISWGNKLNVKIIDNGKGFDVKAVRNDIKKGIGLYNIENRVGLLSGSIKFDSVIGSGTTIDILLPVNE